MREITELRQESNRHESINHHHKRFYEHEGSYYLLDKTMDGAPPFYSLYALAHNPESDMISFPAIMRVDNCEYWGDGISWEKAIAKIEPIILSDGEIINC